MKRQILLTIGLATLLGATAAVGQDQLARSIHDTHVEADRTAEQLKATLGALNELTQQKKGDLRPAYNAYCSEVTKTEQAAIWTRARVQWMAGEGRQYFLEWQNKINGIANESLRKKSQKRLNSVQKSYDNVDKSLKGAAEKFKPFLSDLNDIKTTLAADVTAGGVKALRGTVRTANWNHKYIQGAVDDALEEMIKMEKALSPEAK